MREIKFRAWDTIRNSLRYDILSMDIGFTDEYSCLYMKEMSPLYKKDCIIEQYTGLHDKNGNEIYEGDIVKIQDPYNGCWSTNGAEVIFSNDYVGGWVISNEKHNLNLGTRQNRIKTIGNIHETPELLK